MNLYTTEPLKVRIDFDPSPACGDRFRVAIRSRNTGNEGFGMADDLDAATVKAFDDFVARALA